MAIVVSDTIQSNSPKALEARSGKFVGGIWQPFDSVADANNLIQPAYRHKGLTVNVLKGGIETEYVYRGGTADNHLIEKFNASFPVLNALPFTNAAVIQTLDDFATFSGTEKVIYVYDLGAGGMFLRSETALVADGGIVFEDANGNFYRRHFDPALGINVKWFGAKGDGIQDDLPAFNACRDYITFNGVFLGLEKTSRPDMLIPDGKYRLTNTFKIGGAPISPTDALTYQAYDSGSGAPSYNLTEHLKGGSTLAVGIKCSNLAYIIPDFGPLSELKAVVSYGCYSSSYGDGNLSSTTIHGLKILSVESGNYDNFGTDGPNLAGLVIYGLIPGITVQHCKFAGLEAGLISNMGYMTDFRQLHFESCEKGFVSMGGHGCTGNMFVAYHCELAYDIRSGASAFIQMNTEQCNRALYVQGNNIVFNGCYFEQLADYSAQFPNSYQVQIGNNATLPSILETGIEINAAVITSVDQKDIYVGSSVGGCTLRNISSFGNKHISHNNSKVYYNGNDFSTITGNTDSLTMQEGGWMSSREIELSGMLSADSVVAAGNMAADILAVNTMNMPADGNAVLPDNTRMGPTFGKKKVVITDAENALLILGKLTNDAVSISGQIYFNGLSSGGATLYYQWGADGVLRYIFRYDELPYLYNVPSVNVYQFTMGGENYIGLGFDNGFGSYQPSSFEFLGRCTTNAYTFTSVLKSAVTAITLIKPGELNAGVALGIIAPNYAPLKAGTFYLNYIAKKLYVSVGRDSSADWELLN
jgi:hypothetical protein